MESYITLGVGELELDWGKNFSFRDYSKLFLPNDKKEIPYYYADNEIVLKSGYSKPLSKVEPRLELLGYSLNSLSNHFQNHNDNYPSYLEQPEISIETLLSIFSKITRISWRTEIMTWGNL